MEHGILEIRSSAVPAIKTMLHDALSAGYDWLGWDNGLWENGEAGIFPLKDRRAAEQFCWEEPERMAFGLLPASRVILETLQKELGSSTFPLKVHVDLTRIEHIEPGTGWVQENYTNLVKKLSFMAEWGNHINRQLVEGLKEGNESFAILYALENAGENMQAAVVCGLGAGGGYQVGGLAVRSLQFLESARKGVDDAIESLDWVPYIGEWYREPEIEAVKSLLSSSGLEWPKPHYFPIRKDFTLTLEQACNLYQGRSARLKVPGAGEALQSAWFRLAPDMQDASGNRFLLQYSEKHDYDVDAALGLTPVTETFNKLSREEAVRRLEEGNIVMATRLTAPYENVWLAANPDRLTVAMAVIPALDSLKALLAKPAQSPEETLPEYSFMYDSALGRRPYQEQSTTKEQKNTPDDAREGPPNRAAPRRR